MSEIYSNVLFGLNKVNGVKMTALGTRDGFLISEYENDDSEIMIHMAASMIQAAEKAANQLDKISPNRVIVDFKGEKLIAASAGPKAVISVMATQDASLDPIISELDRTVERIRNIM
ncbi:MAG: roadblock/LC7 domain-containing protein [Candidatus Methanoperedens sp.]|nr:roadblock/LC7 domain-containing protein [Candidatus Methanoperedens sp.]